MANLTVFRALNTAMRTRAPAGLSMVDSSRGWHTMWTGGDGEWDTGTWQRDEPMPTDQSLANFAVFACVTQIAGDIGKLCFRLMEAQGDIWVPTKNPAYSPFMRKPNHFQTMQQFVECWQSSKQIHGNTLALKERDGRGIPIRQYVLDWTRATPLVAPDGSVFYELRTDDLSHIPQTQVTVPASEVVHDRFNCLFHPLIGISPLFASQLAARQGQEILRNSAKYFRNMSRPSGILTAPGKISDETAERLKREWEQNYGAGKIGRTAVLGDALKYEAMTITPEDSQLVEQLKISAVMICATFGVPLWKIGLGPVPAGDQKIQDLNNIYYSDCLQKLIEAFERLQDEALALDYNTFRTEFDLNDLLRMDSKTLVDVEALKAQRGLSSPNESRQVLNLPPVEGGESPMTQQQNFSLAALAKRDASPDPFGTAKPPAPAPAAPDPALEEAKSALAAERFLRRLERRAYDARA